MVRKQCLQGTEATIEEVVAARWEDRRTFSGHPGSLRDPARIVGPLDRRELDRLVIARDGEVCPYCLGQAKLTVRLIFPDGPEVEANLETICVWCLEDLALEEVFVAVGRNAGPSRTGK